MPQVGDRVFISLPGENLRGWAKLTSVNTFQDSFYAVMEDGGETTWVDTCEIMEDPPLDDEGEVAC